jgi:hypothetical protein
MASESIARLLGNNAELRPLTERLEHIKRLQKRYRTLVPGEIADASRVCAIDGTTVVICATSGAVAAALRHVAPRLLEGLRGKVRNSTKSSEDQKLTAVRVEVQVEAGQRPQPVKPRAPMPQDKLSRLAERLSDSPLKEELARIARDHAISRTRSKT